MKFALRNRSEAGHVPIARAAICLAAVLAAGCATTRGGPIPYAGDGSFQPPDPPSVVPLEAGYKIAPMDTVSVKIFKMPDLTGDYRVDLTGNISMPLIGEVRAVGVTTAQLDEMLTDKFGEKYLENPDISVGVIESAQRRITVDGAVKAAGAFPVTGPLTLMQAIALAGGVAEDANARRIAIFRTIDGQRQAAAFDLVSIRRGEMVDPKVYSGDIVVVDGSSLKEIEKKLLRAIPILTIFRPI